MRGNWEAQCGKPQACEAETAIILLLTCYCADTLRVLSSTITIPVKSVLAARLSLARLPIIAPCISARHLRPSIAGAPSSD